MLIMQNLDITQLDNTVKPADILYYMKLIETMTIKDVYNQYYSKKYNGVYTTFTRKVEKWKKKISTDNSLLECANLAYSFKPYKSTVQLNKQGEIVQTWIKQDANIENYIESILNAIRDNVQPIKHEINTININENRLLEIPLADMHFGVCDYDYYIKTRDRLIAIINRHTWDEIHLIIGQDLFHNDDFEGRTTKGTPIEKVDMQKAWNDAKQFYYDIILECINKCKNIYIHYSKGNHDKSIGWTFVQLLKAMFPTLNYDDSLKARKCIYWNKCFIGFGHCEYSKSKSNDLFKQFVLEYPIEYSNSLIREIHCGHLHHETDSDEGIMVRRLPSGNKTDEWSENEGFIGTHKRFMIFEYEPGYLATINYI